MSDGNAPTRAVALVYAGKTKGGREGEGVRKSPPCYKTGVKGVGKGGINMRKTEGDTLAR